MPDERRTVLARALAGDGSMMSTRKKRLDQMGGRKMGGMFDIIFRKRMDRQKQMKDIYADM